MEVYKNRNEGKHDVDIWFIAFVYSYISICYGAFLTMHSIQSTLLYVHMVHMNNGDIKKSFKILKCFVISESDWPGRVVCGSRSGPGAGGPLAGYSEHTDQSSSLPRPRLHLTLRNISHQHRSVEIRRKFFFRFFQKISLFILHHVNIQCYI